MTSFECRACRLLHVGASRTLIDEECAHSASNGAPVRYAGIPTCFDKKWSDRLVPASWLHNDMKDEPGYEAALVAALNESVRPGDRVVVVGGGLGVTSVVAALRAGSSGNIQCFEGSKQ